VGDYHDDLSSYLFICLLCVRGWEVIGHSERRDWLCRPRMTAGRSISKTLIKLWREGGTGGVNTKQKMDEKEGRTGTERMHGARCTVLPHGSTEKA
jgi:hypothetical protein